MHYVWSTSSRYDGKNFPKIASKYNNFSIKWNTVEISIPMMSFSVLSNASKQYLWAIGALSHIINLVAFNSSICYVPWWILHVELSNVGIGIANFKCAFLPLGNNNEAIPLEAIVKTISPFECNAEANVFHIKVFPIPPYPYRKNIPPVYLLITLMIKLMICLCSSVFAIHKKDINYCMSFDCFYFNDITSNL